MFVIFAVILGLTICAVLVFVFFRVYARGGTCQPPEPARHDLPSAPPSPSSRQTNTPAHSQIFSTPSNNTPHHHTSTPTTSLPNQNHTLSFSDNSPQNSTLPLLLPDFWEFNATGYFHSIELIFEDKNVITELSKYCLLIQALSKTAHVLKRMSDVIRTVDSTTPYTVLKLALIQRYTSRSSSCLQTILDECDRNESTVSEYLMRLHSLLGEHYDSSSPLHRDLIRHKLLESLDPQLRLCLYHYEDGPLDVLARHADQLLSRNKNFSPQHPNAKSSSNYTDTKHQTLINEVVDSRLENLQRRVADLTKSAQQPHRHSVGTPTTRPDYDSSYTRASRRDVTTTPQSSVSPDCPPSRTPLCYYHSRFGDRALKCEGPPCPSYTVPQNSRLSKNARTVFMA